MELVDHHEEDRELMLLMELENHHQCHLDQDLVPEAQLEVPLVEEDCHAPTGWSSRDEAAHDSELEEALLEEDRRRWIRHCHCQCHLDQVRQLEA